VPVLGKKDFRRLIDLSLNKMNIFKNILPSYSSLGNQHLSLFKHLSEAHVEPLLKIIYRLIFENEAVLFS